MRAPDFRAAVGALLLVALGSPLTASAQSKEELLEELRSFARGQQELRRELDEVEALVRGRAGARRPAAPAPEPAKPAVAGRVFDLGANPVKGTPGAPLTLVEFTDYQCPYCARYLENTWPEIEKSYVATGKLRYATLDLPLERIHKLAFKAAEATHCAEQQGRFWEMHDRLFGHQQALEPWSAHAEALGLDVGAFEACMESGLFAAAVRRDMEVAERAGADGTPSFLLARTDPNDPTKVEGLALLVGARPFAEFESAIESALGAAEER